MNSSYKPVTLYIPINGKYNKYIDLLNENIKGCIKSSNTLSLEVPPHWGNILRLEK